MRIGSVKMVDKGGCLRFRATITRNFVTKTKLFDHSWDARDWMEKIHEDHVAYKKRMNDPIPVPLNCGVGITYAETPSAKDETIVDVFYKSMNSIQDSMWVLTKTFNESMIAINSAIDVLNDDFALSCLEIISTTCKNNPKKEGTKVGKSRKSSKKRKDT